ncbi:MAG: LysM domain-containing protein [Myxococcota bacterium]
MNNPRTRTTAVVALAFSFIVGPAFAQEFGREPPQPEPEVESEVDPRNPPQAAENHIVQAGDTLWDLTKKYLNSPWYWPKIWSYNPQITNPHWIYPGNELRFYPGEQNSPSPVSVARTIDDVPTEDDDLAIPGELDEEELVKTVGTIEVGRTAPNSVWTTRVGYISAQSMDVAGRVANAESEAIMLSDYDRIYIKMKLAAKKGDQFAIFRPVRRIEHPITGEPYGYAVRMVGGVQVIDTSPKLVTGQIAQAFSPIQRGDYVGPWPESFRTRVAPVPNESETRGFIIDSVGDVLGPLGEHDLVFIDRGRRHGVQRGNTFAVLDRGDKYTRESGGLPSEDVGQLMVLDVQDNASTAIVTFGLREMNVGDKIEMRRN